MNFLNDESIHDLFKQSGMAENLRLELKRQLNLDSDADKAEFAKDVAEMCNTPGGGCLVYGFDDDGNPVGINPEDFHRDRLAQIIADRCQFTSPGIDVRTLKYPLGKFFYDIGVISVPESRFDSPASFRDRNVRTQVPTRIGAVTKYLSPTEAIEYYKQRRRGIPPEFIKVELPSMGVYDSSFSTKHPNISLKRQPFERMISTTWPAIPVFLPYSPKFGNAQTTLLANCGTIVEQDWLTRLAEVENEIQRHHGILTQCWTIRNWELISPLPKEMDYVLGPSIACLKATLDSGQIRQHAYFAWVALAYRQILYVVSGHLNGPLHMRAYMTYVPSGNEFVCLDNGVKTRVRDLGFTKVDSQEIIDWTGVDNSVSDQEMQQNRNPVPAKAISYIGCPNKPDDFPVRGLTLLQIDHVAELNRREEDKIDLLPTFEQGLLPCYISYKGGQFNEGKLNHENTFLSHLVVDCYFFPETESVTYLFTANAGIYYSG